MSSEASKINSDPERQSDDNGATWWCKILVKVVAAASAIVVVFCSVTVFFTIHPICIVAGVWMIGIAIILILLEVPFCCQIFDLTKGFAKWTTDLKYWHKGLLYCVLSIVPPAICFGITTIAGCAPPFCTGVIYGLMSLGKKASRSEMMATARGGDGTQDFTRFENETD